MYQIEKDLQPTAELSKSFSGFLDKVKLAEDPTEQFLRLCPNSSYSDSPIESNRMSVEVIEALYDFATDDLSDAPLLVRVQALQLAIGGAVIKRSKQPLMLEDIPRDELRIDFLGHTRTRHGGKNVLQGPDNTEVDLPSTKMTRYLAEGAGIDPDLILNDENGREPIQAYMFLMNLISKPHLPHRIMQKNEELLSVPLALDVNEVCKNELFSISYEQERELRRDSQEGIEFYTHVDPDVAKYGRALLVLFVGIMSLKKIFPENYGIALQRGAHSLAINTIYALNEHLKSGKSTDIKIPMRGQAVDQGLSLKLEGDEPLRVLKGLSDAIMHLTDTVTSENVMATPVVEYDDFQMYRLWSEDGKGNVSVYIRPYGAHDYDDHLEYGRPREGVEASIDFTIDPSLAENDLFNQVLRVC